MRRKPSAQGQLFEPPKQPRYVQAEKKTVYAAICRARAAGLLVFRVGRGQHRIVRAYGGATTVDTATLLRWFPPV